MDKKRILVADDDARWEAALQAAAGEATLVFVDSLAAALRMFDRRRRWHGAIFDRYLLEGPSPYPTGRLVGEAGFILAVAFADKYPGTRVCICSGDPDMNSVPSHLRRLSDAPTCRYVFKGRHDAATEAVDFVVASAGHRARRSVLDFLVLQPNVFGLGVNLRTVIDELGTYARGRRGKALRK